MNVCIRVSFISFYFISLIKERYSGILYDFEEKNQIVDLKILYSISKSDSLFNVRIIEKYLKDKYSEEIGKKRIGILKYSRVSIKSKQLIDKSKFSGALVIDQLDDFESIKDYDNYLVFIEEGIINKVVLNKF